MKTANFLPHPFPGTPVSHGRRAFCRKAAFLLPALLAAGCNPAPSEPTPTPMPPPTATTAPSPTPRPTATPTLLPAMPTGPLTWQGSERPLLLAHYMPWYQAPPVSSSWGYHWTMNHFAPKQKDGVWQDLASHYTPLIGPYDSSDPLVLEYQALTMILSGIDGVIVDWYGIEPFWDYGLIHSATLKLFEVVKRMGLKFAVCYEDQTVKHMVNNGRLKKEEAVAHGQKVMAFLQAEWFGDDAYLKYKDRPVLYNFGPQYFKGDDWKNLFADLDPQPLFVTLDKAIVPGANAGYPWPPMWASKGGVLSHDVLLSYLNDFYDMAEDWPFKTGGAWPGFNDIYKEAGVGEGYGFLDALEGQTLRFTLQLALDHPQDVIQLVTWNDYGEGTNIEPTVEYGYRYLEIVQEARRATDPAFAFSAADLPLPFRLWEKRVKHAGDADANLELDQAAEATAAGDLKKAAEILDRLP